MYCSNIILTHTIYIRVATNNINLFARIYHVTRRTATIARYLCIGSDTNGLQQTQAMQGHLRAAGSSKLWLKRKFWEMMITNHDIDSVWMGFLILMANFNMHGICLMCISSILMCCGFPTSHRHLSHGNMVLILGMVVPSYSTKYCKRGQRRSWHKDFQPIAHKVLCKSVSLHNFVSVNIVLMPKPQSHVYLPDYQHLNLFLSIRRVAASMERNKGVFSSIHFPKCVTKAQGM